MARIRTIKPEFFRHEGLQDLEAEHPGSYAMLTFAALWGHCDKAGRFEWKPRTLKLDILPFLPFDMLATLRLLERAGFVRRYVVDGKEFGEVPTFADHQRLGGKEAQEPAKYPEPTGEASGKLESENQESTGEATGKQLPSQEGKGREGEEEGNGSSSLRSDSSPAAPVTAKAQKFELQAAGNSSTPPKPADLQATRAQRLAQVTKDAVEAFNASKCVKSNGGLMSAVRMTVGKDVRQKEVERCLSIAREICVESYGGPAVSPEFWADYFLAVHEDDFYSGRQGGGRGHENWTPDFELLTRRKTMLKIYNRATDEEAA